MAYNFIAYTFLIFLLAFSPLAFCETFIDLEASFFQPEYNKVQIPNDRNGDYFDITNIRDDSLLAARLTAGWVLNKHELQFVMAPFSYSETGKLDENIGFNGETFTANDAIDVRYQFSSYRLRYLYQLVSSSTWSVDIGATLFVRDASIALSQKGVSTENNDLGLVPLLAFRASYALNKQWALMLDSDFAWSPQGRAIDLALLASYQLDNNWVFAGGYRTIEGGADNETIYNFAWFNALTFKVSYRWP